MAAQENRRNTGNPSGGGCTRQPDAREGQAGPAGVTDRLVVPTKPHNGGGGKGPDFGSVLDVGERWESDPRVYNLPTLYFGTYGRDYEAGEGRARSCDRGPSSESRRRAGCGKSACPVRRAGSGNGARADILALTTERVSNTHGRPKPPRHFSTLLDETRRFRKVCLCASC